jgi:plastocyanin
MKRILNALPGLLLLSLGWIRVLPAADIEGSVVITKTLTRPRVTAAVPLYQRGAAVNLGPVHSEDPLELERSRVVIYLEGDGPSSPVAATMQQMNREFVPDVLAIPAGSEVTFPNLDPIFHNVFSLSKARSFDLGSYRKGESRTVKFNRAGIVYVNCHLHSNMTAAIVVTPNGWSTRADRNGRFTIRNVPPGRYTAVAWHKSAGFFRQTVEVTQDRSATLEFLLPLCADSSGLEARN